MNLGIIILVYLRLRRFGHNNETGFHGNIECKGLVAVQGSQVDGHLAARQGISGDFFGLYSIIQRVALYLESRWYADIENYHLGTASSVVECGDPAGHRLVALQLGSVVINRNG